MEDVYELILLNMNIDTLQNACRTNRNHKICNDFNFWIKKFKYDDIPILAPKLPKTIIEWIREYKKVENIINIVNDIFNNIMTDDVILQIKYDHSTFDLRNNTLFFLLPQELFQFDNMDYYRNQSIKLEMLKTNKNIELTFFVHYRVHGIAILTYNEFKLMLIRLIYYIPKLRLFGNNILLLDY